MTRSGTAMFSSVAALIALAGGAQPPATGDASRIVIQKTRGVGATEQPFERQTNRTTQTADKATTRTSAGRGWLHRITYLNKYPVTVAQAKRNARKRRNQLRAKGQHRKAQR